MHYLTAAMLLLGARALQRAVSVAPSRRAALHATREGTILIRNTQRSIPIDVDAVGLSHVGQAAYELLRTKHEDHHKQQWNVAHGRVVGDLHQTPRMAWPGPEEGPHDDGHDDWFPEAMADIMKRTQVWCDVCSLGPPDGLFMERFKEALAVIAENAADRPADQPVIVRMMFGNIIGMPVNCNGIIKKLTANANSAFKARDWMEAARSYTYILQLSRRHDKKFAAVCLSNRCACWLKVRPPR